MPPINKNGYLVKLSENALISLILSGLEAYSINHQNIGRNKERVMLETCGNLFGHETVLSDGRTTYHVDVISTDTSAKQARHSVGYSVPAIEMKIDTVTSFWPHLDYLGDFHSHPYENYQQAHRAKGYYFSEGDREDLKVNSDFWRKIRHRVGLLLAIGPMKKIGRREPQWIDSNYNTVELNLGNFKLWLTAYCSFDHHAKRTPSGGTQLRFTKDNDPLVMLDCPAITGLIWQHTPFGKVHVKDKEAQFLSSASSSTRL